MSKKEFAGRKWNTDLVRSRCEVDGDCWIWANGLNNRGYPQASIERKPQLVGRWVLNQMLTSAGRKPLNSKEVAVPRCANRLCVSPACPEKRTRSKLLIESYASKARDKEIEARRERAIARGWAKLTHEQAREIRLVQGQRRAVDLGNEFGVHPDTIRRIWRGDKWREQHAANSVFTWRPAA